MAGTNSNEALIEKTIETSSFLRAGLLNPVQQDAFIVLVKKFSVLLPLVRFHRMKHAKEDIDKLHIGEPVTVSVDENTDPGVLQKPKFNKVELAARKVQSAWNMSTETLQQNIEQDDFETVVMNAMVERIATDLELLAIQGDTAIPITPTPLSLLLRRLDGWVKQTEGSHVINANGGVVSKALFSAAKRALPKQYKNDPGLRWLISDTLATDWLDTLADRATPAGDAALQGSGVAPYGVPMQIVPLIPDDLPVPIATATYADVVGDRFGPFNILTGANSIRIKVNGAPADGLTITLSSVDAALETVVVANVINSAIQALPAADAVARQFVAEDNGQGRLRLRTTTVGPDARIELLPVANDCYTALGLTVGTYSGAAAGAGTVNEGSLFWLTNPRNFIYAILDGTRIYTDFNKNFDRIESVVYNEVAVAIENIEAVVKVKNVRAKPLGV